MAIGYAAYPFVHEPWEAYAAALVAGVGNGIFWTSQSTLLTGLTPHDRRHAAFAVQRVTRNLGIGLGGLAGGLIATTANPTSFTVLFLIDAVTFLAFIFALYFVPEPVAVDEPSPEPVGYREVFRHGVFVAFVAPERRLRRGRLRAARAASRVRQERGRGDRDRRSGSSSS